MEGGGGRYFSKDKNLFYFLYSALKYTLAIINANYLFCKMQIIAKYKYKFTYIVIVKLNKPLNKQILNAQLLRMLKSERAALY